MERRGIKGNKITLPNMEHWEFFTGEIDSARIHSVKKSLTLHRRKHPKATVALFMYSEGGDPDLAVDFYWFVKMAKFKLVAIGGGQMSSAATLILLAAETRYVLPDTLFYFHEGRPGVRSGHDLTESKGMVQLYQKRNETIRKLIANETGIKERTLSAWDNACKTITALDARRQGLVNDVLEDPRLVLRAKRSDQRRFSKGYGNLRAV